MKHLEINIMRNRRNLHEEHFETFPKDRELDNGRVLG